MKLIFGGVRGTNTVAHSDFLKYGGETTAVLIEGRGGEKVVIDAGTGLRVLGERLVGGAASDASVLMLMTHYHLDHIMGLPSFNLLYDKRWAVTVTAPRRQGLEPGEIVRRILAKPFWPVQLDQLHARLRFITLPERSLKSKRHGGLEIRWCAVHHPDGCHAYRIDEPATGAALVFATDIEWAISTAAERQAFHTLCREPHPAQLLVMDGQFDRATIAPFKGWGHSAWEDGIEVARATGMARVLITHHAPQHNDIKLAATEMAARRTWPNATLARSGMEVEIHG